MANETVTYDLATILSEMRADIKQIQSTQTTILVNQAKLEAEVLAIKAQNWTLIIAVVGFIGTAILPMFYMNPSL